MKTFRKVGICILLTAPAFILSTASTLASEVDFEADVLPILARRCKLRHSQQ
jgi:hypothetical protein